MKIILVKDPEVQKILERELDQSYIVILSQEIEKAIEIYEV